MSPRNEGVLQALELSRHFGGTAALNGVTFSVAAGEIVGLIGPNGAGKTTLLNLLSGVLAPSSGRVLFRGRDLAGLRPHAIARLGIARTLQAPRSFSSMTVLENVAVGATFGQRLRLAAALTAAEPVLDLVGLGRRRDAPLASLNLQERKTVELARALAMAPRVLLLDETMSGLNPAEIDDSVRLIRRIRDQTGVAIVWVEHAVKAIMRAAERIIVLDFGSLIAAGAPAQIAANSRVIEAYLGTPA